MTICIALQHAAETLQSAGVPDPRTDAGILLAHVTSLPRLELLLNGAQALTMEQEQRLSSLLLLRTARRPLQYLLGEQYFYGRSYLVDERVLIPRPETESLCELAIAYLRSLSAPRALDLCTGSGAIAVTLKLECPAAQIMASDISEAALAVARANAARHQAHIDFALGDLFAPAQGLRFHCIVSNPPYIESAACQTLQAEVLEEPPLALDGGADGLRFYRCIAAEAADHLTPGGLLCMEIGDTQAEAVCALFAETGRYADISAHPDLGGTLRMVCAYALSSPT